MGVTDEDVCPITAKACEHGCVDYCDMPLKATLWDRIFWWWLATFRPRAFLHLYGDRAEPKQKEP